MSGQLVRAVVSRRRFLGAAMLGVAGSVLAACQPQVVERSVEVTKIVEVEKPVEVTKVVEQQVEVTKIVEQQVEVTRVVEIEKETIVTATAVAASALEPAELFWTAWGSENDAFISYRKQIALFNEQYPQITIRLEPQGGFDKIAVMFAAGTAPDMIYTNVPAGYSFIGHGQLLSLTPYIRSDPGWEEDMSTFVEAMLDMHTFRGELYGIPNTVETSGTIYNADMLTAAGLKTPAELGEEWTWDKFVEYGKVLTKGEDGPDKIWGAYVGSNTQFGLGDFVYPLVEGTNNTWVNDDGVTTGVDSEEFTQATQYLVDFVQLHKASPAPSILGTHDQVYAPFVNSQVGMMISGDWAFGFILTRIPPDKKFKLDWAVSPYAPNGKTSGVGHSVANAVWAKTKYRDHALAWQRMYSGQAMQNEITNAWEYWPALSPRRDAQDYFWKKQLIPNEAGIRMSYDIAKPYPRTPVGDAGQLVTSVADQAIDKLLDGQDTRSVPDLLKDLAIQINENLARAAEGKTL